MEKIVRIKLKQELMSKVKGNISVHSVDDTLIIDIQSENENKFHYTINTLSAKISAGLSSKIIADIVVKKYKAFILSQHFYGKIYW